MAPETGPLDELRRAASEAHDNFQSMWVAAIFSVVFLVSPAQEQATQALNRAYSELREKNYDQAIEDFRRAVKLDPSQVQVHKDLAYTFLKMGETESAVEAFEAHHRAKPEDLGTVMELAYLYVQVQKESLALEFFRIAMESGDNAVAAQARQGFQNVEAPIVGEITRWSQAIQAEPDNLDARESLAEALVRHGDLRPAIEQYQWLRRNANTRYRHLITLSELHAKLSHSGAAEADARNSDIARAYALLALRSPDPRLSGQGRGIFGDRYPYAPEFEKALELEPWQTELRKELAFLYLQLGRRDRAVELLERVIKDSPGDAVAEAQLRALNPKPAAAPVITATTQASAPAADPVRRHKELGYASLQKSFLADAVREFEEANKLDPGDQQVILQLGYLYNMLHRDDVALRWFKLARSSADKKVATQARQAVRNLEQPRFTTTVWALPLLSSRFDSAFGYGQTKSEWNTKKLHFRPYLSMRFEGDSRTRTGGTNPVVLSADGVIAAAGIIRTVAPNTWFWAEAGNALSAATKESRPDYRAGIAFSRVWGAKLFSDHTGRFLDSNFDAVYLSRVDHDTVVYTQTKTGYQLPAWRDLHHQVFLAANVVVDDRRNVYNNFVEFGPAYRFCFTRFKQVWAYAAWLHGTYTMPGRSNYNDLRLVVWWAKSFSR